MIDFGSYNNDPPAPTAEVINKMEESWFGGDPLEFTVPPTKTKMGGWNITYFGHRRYIDL